MIILSSTERGSLFLRLFVCLFFTHWSGIPPIFLIINQLTTFIGLYDGN